MRKADRRSATGRQYPDSKSNKWPRPSSRRPNPQSLTSRRRAATCAWARSCIERGKIDTEDLERALELQKERGDKIGKILVDMGFIAQRDVLAALSDQLGVPLVTIDGPPPAAPEIEGLSPRFLRQCRAFPIALARIARSRSRWPIRWISRPSPPCAPSPACRSQTALAAEQEILDAIDRITARAEQQPLDVEGDDDAGQRRSRTPARHGERGAGHPPGQRHDRRRPSRSAPAIFTSSRSRRNSASASASTACCSTRSRRRAS